MLSGPYHCELQKTAGLCILCGCSSVNEGISFIHDVCVCVCVFSLKVQMCPLDDAIFLSNSSMLMAPYVCQNVTQKKKKHLFFFFGSCLICVLASLSPILPRGELLTIYTKLAAGALLGVFVGVCVWAFLKHLIYPGIVNCFVFLSTAEPGMYHFTLIILHTQAK